jgi:hypothetical protein
MKELMALYGATLGKRYTKKQKAYFINQIGEFYPENGFLITLLEKKTRFFHLMNVVAGDISRAKTVFIAGYDTPSSAFFPITKYYPFHAEKNIAGERLDIVMKIVLAVLAVLGAFFCFRFSLNALGGMKAAYLGMAGVLTLVAILAMWTRANPFNFNRNSASLAVMAKIAENCKQNPEIAFVFLDYEASAFEGLKALVEDKRFLDKTLIMLDCLASGETLLVAHRAAANHQARRLIELAMQAEIELTDREYGEQRAEQNVMSFGKHLLYIASGFVEDKEFIVKKTKTKRDIDLDLKRLNGIAQFLTAYAGNGANKVIPKRPRSIDGNKES